MDLFDVLIVLARVRMTSRLSRELLKLNINCSNIHHGICKWVNTILCEGSQRICSKQLLDMCCSRALVTEQHRQADKMRILVFHKPMTAERLNSSLAK